VTRLDFLPERDYVTLRFDICYRKSVSLFLTSLLSSVTFVR